MYNSVGDYMKKLLLCILDGVGINQSSKGNAYMLAKTPNLDKIINKYPHSKLVASGCEVGLPKGIMGNSEVGHTNIGAGRVILQGMELINNSIKTHTFENNPELKEMLDYVRKNNTRIHLMGLVSDGGVHSSLLHLQTLIDILDKNNIPFYLHIFTDGRDTLPHSSLEYINKLDLKKGKIATISGRYYAMDRDNRYTRVKRAYDVITGASNDIYPNLEVAIKRNYEKGITDEFICPGIIDKEGCVSNHDGIIFFNFRPDRLRELGSALTNDDFNGFERVKKDIKLLTMASVSDEVICTTMFKKEKVKNTLGEYISKKGLKQLRIAETEKYAHVTYFFDGGVELELDNCKRILIPSPKVATYDLKPEMSAYEITNRLLPIMNDYDFIVLNFANGDMVGHTGNLEAAIKAVEVVDECVGKIYENYKGTMIITADHGNCEEMLDKDGNILTSHTTNLVNFIVTAKVKLKDGKLADIAPTILKLLNLKIPKEMTGKVLIKNKKEKVFTILSTIFILSMFVFYVTRFIYFYVVR